MDAHWRARSAFALMLAAVAVLIGGGSLRSLGMVGIGVTAACLLLADEYWSGPSRGAEVAGARSDGRWCSG
jgi:hypothetical protein